MSGRAAATRALLVVGLLVAPGCAGSAGDDAGLSHDEFVEQAGEICQRHFAAIRRLERRLDPTRGGGLEGPDFLARVGQEFRDLALDLSLLEPPPDLDDRFRATLRAIQRLGDGLDQAARRSRAGDTEGRNAALRAANNPEIERFFKSEGITACAP